MDNIQFMELAETWHDQLKYCQFAGEIPLSIPDLTNLAGRLQSFRNIKQRELYECMVLIAAVNCAYYFYDDEGFWTHFIELSGIDDTQTIGVLIERTLRRYGLLSVERTGPFRYVGAILEQCGISMRYVGAFAQVVRAIKSRYGWRTISKVTYPRFISIIKDFIIPRYLKDFLLDQVGYKFTIETCRLISMYDDHLLTIEDLNEANGYRPGFWSELLQVFGYKKDKVTKSDFYADPIIFFDVISRTITLKFPKPEYAARIFNEGNFTFPVTILVHPHDFFCEYGGRIGDRDWRINGWVPGNRPILFERNAAAAMINSTNIYPGEYYLVAPSSYAVPNYMLVKELGTANLCLDEQYEVYVIKVESGDVLSGYKIHDIARKGSDIELQWKNTETWYFKYSDEIFDVFEGNIPELEFDFELLRTNSIALFYEVGRIKGRIKNSSDFEMLKKAITNSLPAKGSIWVDTIDRTRKNWTRPELRFGVVPEILPDLSGPIDNDKDLNLCFKTYKGGTLRLFDCHQIDTHTWKVPVKIKKIYGEFISRHDNLRLKFSIPLTKMALIDKEGWEIRVFSETDLHYLKHLRISGLQNTQVQVVLGTGAFECAFDSQGKSQFPIDCLRDFTKTGFDPLYIRQGSRNVHTGAFFLDTSLFVKNICQDGIEGFSVDTSSDIFRTIELLSNMAHHPFTRLTMNKCPRFNKELDKIVDLFLSCAEYFDQTHITIDGKACSWVNVIDQSIVQECMRREIEQLDYESAMLLSKIVPPVTRWLQMLSNIIPAKPLRDLIIEWSSDVKSARFMGMKSEIARVTSGGVLTRAWIYYRSGEYLDAILCLQKCNRDDSVLATLNNLLQAVLYMRQARFHESYKVLADTERNDAFASVFDVLWNFSLILTDSPDSQTAHLFNINDSSVTLDFIEIIPFADRDSKLLRYFVTNMVTDRQSLSVSGDWLASWVDFKYCKQFRPDILLEAAEQMYLMIEEIPVSPNRTAMIAEINKVTRRKHYGSH